jgi:hypothetical protein
MLRGVDVGELAGCEDPAEFGDFWRMELTGR